MDSELDHKIAQLTEWSRAELLAEWDRIYKNMPSNRVSREMLTRGIAFRWQETAYGGLKSEGQKLLNKLVRDYQRSPSSISTDLQIKIGTRLRRLWNGKVCEVTVGQEGFIYDGKRYGSLSEIARLITNTRWNGRVFFGLKSSAKPKSEGVNVQAAA